MTSIFKLRNLMASAAALVALPLAAQAQTGPGFSGAMTLGYSSSNIDIGPGDADVTGMSLDIETDVAFSSAFSVGLDFGVSTSSIDLGVGDLEFDLIGLAIEPVYQFGNGAYAGVYYRMGDFDLSIPPLLGSATFGIDTQSYGVFGGYEHGPLWVEAFVGTSDTDLGLFGEIDILDYGIAASYQINGQLGVFGSVLRTDIEAFTIDVDLTSAAIGADYDFGNGFMAYGSVGFLNVNEPFGADISGNNLTLGGSYDLSGMGTPVILSAEYSRTTIDIGAAPPFIDPEVDRFAVGLTIPLGGGSSTPLNSNTRTARGDYRSVIAALANSI